MNATHFWLDEVDLVSPPTVTPQVVRESMPRCKDPLGWAESLNHYISGGSAFDSTELIAIFLAQVGHESADLRLLSESMNYKSQRLISLFGRHRITAKEAARYGRHGGQKANQKMIANTLYGGDWGARVLGNTEPNDGWDFRGSGILQLTGRANFELCAADTGLPIVSQPELVRTDKAVAAQTALWFWDEHVSAVTLKHTTKQINGGFNGLPDRRARYERTLRALKGEL